MAGLFDDINPLPFNKVVPNNGKITKGSLISFAYPISQALVPNIIHDPRPMVIVTDIWPQYLRGVNLHYLTFPYIKRLLQTHGGNPGFSYAHIRPDRYIANAFRVYANRGILQPKRLDTEWLLNLLGSVRSFNPGEIEKIRTEVEKQIQARLQIKANELTAYDQWRTNITRNTLPRQTTRATTTMTTPNIPNPPTTEVNPSVNMTPNDNG